MSWDYIKDGFNPRGAEYGASARAARAAKKTQQGMDDMLTLAMQPNERARMIAAQQIAARRQREAKRESNGRAWQTGLCLLFLALCFCVYQLGDDNSAVSRVFASITGIQHADDANAPVSPPAAPK